jgi:hypothetical protein
MRLELHPDSWLGHFPNHHLTCEGVQPGLVLPSGSSALKAALHDDCPGLASVAARDM